MKLHKTIITLTILILNILCLAQFAGGSGTIEDPYLIQTADQLNLIRNHMTSSFKQVADIDLGVPPWNEGTGWQPIGDYIWTDPTKSFRGDYDGGGYKILNMQIINFNRAHQGLFGSTEGCLLKNINLTDFSIDTVRGYLGGLTGISYNDTWLNISVVGTIKGYSDMGLISGFFEGYNIADCHAKGEIISTGGGWIGGLVATCNADSVINCASAVTITSNGIYIGGLFGEVVNVGVINHCYSEANIFTGNDSNCIGGLIGDMNIIFRDCNILNCFSLGSIISEASAVGGLIGIINSETETKILDSYSKVNLSGINYIGGFTGYVTKNTSIENCYSTGQVTGIENTGGFLGKIDSLDTVSATNCYWDMETSGIDSSAAGEGRTTPEMTVPGYGSNTYVGWGFGSVWADDIYNLNGRYPMLQWACGIEDDEDDLVDSQKGFDLYQNYPNPFNPVTQIKFDLTKTSDVKLSIYNINGQKIAELANGVMNAGKHIIEFNGENLNSGVYYCIIKVDGRIQSKRMLLVK